MTTVVPGEIAWPAMTSSETASRETLQAGGKSLRISWITGFKSSSAHAVLERLPLLDVTDAAVALANMLVTGQALPAQAAQDALHLAVACVHGMQYLLTWNCTHLANARLRSRIEQVCREAGYIPPIICTPEELEG